jgi:hypothetical protein
VTLPQFEVQSYLKAIDDHKVIWKSNRIVPLNIAVMCR